MKGLPWGHTAGEGQTWSSGLSYKEVLLAQFSVMEGRGGLAHSLLPPLSIILASSSLTPLLVSWGRHNPAPQMGRLKQRTSIVAQSGGWESQIDQDLILYFTTLDKSSSLSKPQFIFA